MVEECCSLKDNNDEDESEGERLGVSGSERTRSPNSVPWLSHHWGAVKKGPNKKNRINDASEYTAET